MHLIFLLITKVLFPISFMLFEKITSSDALGNSRKGVTKEEKEKVWKLIANELCVMSAVERTASQIKKKHGFPL